MLAPVLPAVPIVVVLVGGQMDQGGSPPFGEVRPRYAVSRRVLVFQT